MIVRRMVAVSAFVLGTVTGARAEGRDLIVNGDFSHGVVKRPWNEVHPGSPDIPGWHVLRNVDYVPVAYWEAPGGVASIDLDGSPGPGEIAQTFATSPGHRYRVAFDLAANVDGPPRVKALVVRVAGTTRAFAFDGTGHANRAMGYARKTFEFTASGTSSTIDFASQSRPGNWNGPVLGRVSVVDVAGSEAEAAQAAQMPQVPTPTLDARTSPPPPLEVPPSRQPRASGAPNVALAPRARDATATVPHGLEGRWHGSFHGTPVLFLIRETAGVTIADLVSPDAALGLSKISWDGTLANGRIVALEVCQRTNQANVLTYGLIVRVLDANEIMLERNRCLDGDLIVRRAP
ncbi:MAG: hypothetical protein NVS2B8_19590 [Vulcanimicrobiaceae bacterium]